MLLKYKTDAITNTIYIYIACILLLYLVKPKSFFSKDGNIKQFGVGYCKNSMEKKTLFHLNLLLLMLIFIIYLVSM